MGIYLVFAVLAAVFFVAGFATIVAGWVAFACWFLAAFFVFLSWLAYRARARTARPPGPP